MGDRTKTAGLWALVVIGLAGARDAPYSSKAGNFRVEFPGRPKTANQNLPGPGGGKVATHSATAKGKDGSMYGVNYAEYPGATEAMLDAAVDAMIKSARMRPTAREAIVLDGHPGRDVTFEVDPPRGAREKGVGHARCFLVGRRIYQVLVLGPESKLSADAMDAFLDSFALIEPVAAAVAAPGVPGAATPGAVAAGPMVDRTEPPTPVDPDGDCKITIERNGATVVVPAKVHDLSPMYKMYNAPRLMRDVSGDFAAETRVLWLEPEGQGLREGVAYRGAGLLFWQDQDHYLRFERASILRDGNRQAFLFFTKVENGQEVFQGGNPLPQAAVTLKLERKGERLLASFSTDGKRWEDLKSMDIASWAASGQVGVSAINATAKPLAAQFEAYKLRAAETGAPPAKEKKRAR